MADLHTAFQILPIADTCTWYGTTWEGTGQDAVLIPCGAPTIGAGVFCNPSHTRCTYHSLCERHSRGRRAQDWKIK